MRNLLLLLLLSGLSFGQNFDRFYTLDSIQMKNTADEIALSTGKNFVFTGYNNGDKYKTALYKNIDEPNEETLLQVSFKPYMDGENKALEIKGVKKFALRAVSGKYLAVAPIWKKYFDPNADIIKMSNDELIKLPYPRSSSMRKNENEDNFWTIYFRD